MVNVYIYIVEIKMQIVCMMNVECPGDKIEIKSA